MQYDRRSLIASLASLPFCQIPFGAARAQQVERPSLKLGVANKTHLYYLPLTLAERRGHFKDYGLTVTLSDFEGGGQSLDALLAGSVDVVTGAYEHTLHTQAKGQDIRAVIELGRFRGMEAGMDVKEVDWIGTSLGGMIAIVLAGLPGNSMRRLVINVIGPSLPWAGLARIGSYVSAMPADFRGLEEVEADFRDVLAPFGNLSDEHWGHIARHSVAWNANRGRYVMLCDPEIVRAFRNPWHYSVNLWKYWTAIKVPILVIRGAGSDLLPPDLANEMIRRNSRAKVLEIDGCGHAPRS